MADRKPKRKGMAARVGGDTLRENAHEATARDRRQCKGESKKTGKPCRAAPLTGEEYCRAHGNRPDEDRFGSPIWSAKAGGSEKPSVPKPMELARQIVEARAEDILNPYLRTLGMELRDGELYRIEGGGAKVTAAFQGHVFTSSVDDLGAQITAIERLLDRIYGKPKQAIEASGPDGGPIPTEGRVDLKRLKPDELKTLRGLLERAGEAEGG